MAGETVVVDGIEYDLDTLEKRLNDASLRESCEGSLYEFLKHSWKYIDSAPFTPGWAMEAVAEHLEAVADGEIKRLIINIPPRCSKSTLVSVTFPAWVWAQPQFSATSGPGVQFLCASYAQQLVLRDSVKCRRLISSPWYQNLWGSRFSLVGDQNTKSRFANDKGGERLITSVDSGVTGEGASIIVVDDANAANEAFSEATILNTIEWWDGTMSTRLNDPKTGAYIIIQQRLAEDDLTGHVLSKDHFGEWAFLCLPMRYEWRRHCSTPIGWNDPRGVDEEGEPLVLIDENGVRFPRDTNAEDELNTERESSLLWPERFGEKEVARLERQLGPFSAAGQLQQSPSPKGGGIIQSDWWNTWPDQEKYPPMDFVIASLDTAFTTDTKNDYSALTVWGVFSGTNKTRSTKTVTRDGRVLSVDEVKSQAMSGSPAVMLMYAWQERLEINPLVEKVMKTCKQMQVDRLLIENKASGHSVNQELRRLYQNASFGVHLVDPKRMDKMARLYATQHIFSEGMVYAPDKQWADEVIKQVSQFPNGKHDDLVDTVSMALRHLRDMGLLARTEEVLTEVEEELRYSGQNIDPLYEV